MSELDYDDPRVRQMLDEHHLPEEMWAMSGTLLSIFCGMCGQRWPCEVRRTLDDMDQWRRRGATE